MRLPTEPELEALRNVALAGVHPPECMPFAVAWTDDPELASFLPYHEQRWGPPGGRHSRVRARRVRFDEPHSLSNCFPYAPPRVSVSLYGKDHFA
jgi:hypothetical protein